MKKTIICLSVLVALTGIAYGQNDTTKVQASNPKWEDVQYRNTKTGETKTKYQVTIEGKTYPTNKTSYQRGQLIPRFGVQPCLVLITNKNGKQRVAVL